MHALIVEDDPQVRELLQRLVQLRGHTTEAFASGEEALAALGASPDLALIDWALPGMDGLDLIRALRRRAGSDRMHVLVITGHDDPVAVALALESGADDFLGKPAGRAQIETRLAVAERHLQAATRRASGRVASPPPDPLSRALLEAIPDLVFILTRDGLVTGHHASDPTRLLLPPGQFLDRRIHDILPPETAGPMLAAIRRAIDSGERQAHEFTFLHTDGLHHFDSWMARLDATRAVMVVHEVTGRRQAEQELRRSAELLRLFVEHTPLAVAMFDRHMRYIAHSRRWVLDYRLSGQPIIGRSHYEVFPEIPARWREIHRRCLAGEVLGCSEDPFPRQDGTLDWVRWELVPWREGTGDIGGIIMFTDVITAQVEEREEARRLEERMQHAQKVESLGILAGGVAHDFNNLLVGILGNAELARLEIPPASAAHELLDQIEKAGRRAAELTRQMLAYSGHGKFHLERVDLSELIREMVRLLETSISRRIHLVFDFEPELPLIEVDATQIRQVVMNLILNAAEAIGDAPGTVAVRTSCVTVQPGETVRSTLGDELPPGPHLLLEVEDSGCGMDAATERRIFEPFFTTKFTGRGLGLAAVQGIVRGHRGAITVDTGPNRGTVFRVYLPLRQASEAAPPAEPLSPESPPHPRRILVVEDEEVVRAYAAHLLQRDGHTVHLAEDGEAALSRLESLHASIDLILLDLTMPRRDGRGVLAEVRARHPALPIIVTSGHPEDEVVRLLDGLAWDSFVPKPFVTAELRRAIRDVFPA